MPVQVVVQTAGQSDQVLYFNLSSPIPSAAFVIDAASNQSVAFHFTLTEDVLTASLAVNERRTLTVLTEMDVSYRGVLGKKKRRILIGGSQRSMNVAGSVEILAAGGSPTPTGGAPPLTLGLALLFVAFNLFQF